MGTDPSSSAPAEPPNPRMFGQRQYNLPDEVHANIPQQHYHGAPQAWEHARGVLIELCRQLCASPVALYYSPLYTEIGNPDGAVVTAIVQDRRDQMITVVWRRYQHPRLGPQGHGWHLTVNGVTPPRGTGFVSAAPPWLARIVSVCVDH